MVSSISESGMVCVYRPVLVLLCSVLVFGCSKRGSEASTNGEPSSFEVSVLPELERLSFPSTKPQPLLFIDASEDASGLYAVEGAGDETVVRLVDPDAAFDPLTAQVLYEHVGRAKDQRVGVNGVIYTAESGTAWTPPEEDEDDTLSRAAKDDEGASAPEEGAPEPTVAEKLQPGAFGRQRLLRFNRRGVAEEPTRVSTFDANARALRRSTNFSAFDLADSGKTAVVRRSEPARAVRAAMGPDEVATVFPPGYVIGAATSTDGTNIGWFFVGEEGLEVLGDAQERVGVVQDAATEAAMSDVTDASFIAVLRDGGMLVALKRKGSSSELYYLSAPEPFTDESTPVVEADTQKAEDDDEKKPGEPALVVEASEKGAGDKDAGEGRDTAEALKESAPKYRAFAHHLKNEEDQALPISLLGGGGLGLPTANHRVLKDDALYFAYGPGAVGSQWTRVYRASREGWTLFDHKVASGHRSDEAVWGAVRSALAPFLFDAGDRGVFLSLGEQAVYLNVDAEKGQDWTIVPLETRLPKLKTAAAPVASEGWVYLNASFRARLRAPSRSYAVALNIQDGQAVVLSDADWIGAVSSGHYQLPFHPDRLSIDVVIGRDELRQLFAVHAANPQEGRVTLGVLPEGVKEVRVFGISIGPRRLLQLIRDDGRAQIAVLDVREPDSLRLVDERAVAEWKLLRNGEEVPVQAKATRPLSGL